MRKYELSTEKIDEMIKLKKERLSNEKIADITGVPYLIVGPNLRKNMEDYDKYSLRRRKDSIPLEMIDKMIKLKKERMYDTEIGKRVGLTPTLVRSILKDHMEDYDKYKYISRKDLRKVKFKEKKEKMLESLEGEVNSKKACILVSCRPTIELLDTFSEKYDAIQSNKEEIREMIIKIEKRLFKINKFRSEKIILAAALYLSVKLTQSYCHEIIGVSEVSIRDLIKLIKIKRNIFKSKFKPLKKGSNKTVIEIEKNIWFDLNIAKAKLEKKDGLRHTWKSFLDQISVIINNS